ncbi:GSU0071 family protein [Geomesophilobacter sediminis]|uniref:Uncharacterized protein n=1 Tax=Geomesophilobacter sediminis TaxID=2798584 RepID=A0A8J7S8J7_9BACT|nr:hypothetical protein [Geomesophilobacter sediminis]MBJ6727597.1 hypothetical protein [Geomesophilobacter sediminis]
MNKESIDEAIEFYVTERMTPHGKKKALSHFLACLYLKQQREEIVESLRKVLGLSRYYIDLAKVMLNPFKGPELAWLATMISLAVYGGVLMSIDEEQTLGICLFSGAVVNAGYLIRSVAKKWCDLHVMIAIYTEIIQIVDDELEQLA